MIKCDHYERDDFAGSAYFFCRYFEKRFLTGFKRCENCSVYVVEDCKCKTCASLDAIT